MAGKTVELDVRDRLNLLSILPREGNFLKIKLIRELREELSFSVEEHELLKFTELPGGQVTWDPKGFEEIGKKTIGIPTPTMDLIVETLKDLDKKNKLNEGYISLYEMFVL